MNDTPEQDDRDTGSEYWNYLAQSWWPQPLGDRTPPPTETSPVEPVDPLAPHRCRPPHRRLRETRIPAPSRQDPLRPRRRPGNPHTRRARPMRNRQVLGRVLTPR